MDIVTYGEVLGVSTMAPRSQTWRVRGVAGGTQEPEVGTQRCQQSDFETLSVASGAHGAAGVQMRCENDDFWVCPGHGIVS